MWCIQGSVTQLIANQCSCLKCQYTKLQISEHCIFCQQGDHLLLWFVITTLEACMLYRAL